MGNISALSQTTTAATALSNLILVSPQSTIGYQPQNPTSQNGTTTQPPPALLFHYEGDQTGTLASDITDHYIEDNTAIQDQIALRPPVISTHGFIGELNDVPPAALAAVKAIANKLTTISAYTPALSASALLAYNQAFELYQVANNAVNSAVSAWNTINNTQSGESVIGQNAVTGLFGLTIQPNQTKQQQMFQQFFGYWNSRTLFTVQTPWAVFQNMAIENLVAVQDASTNMITDFNVTFKQIRMATTQVATGGTSVDPANTQGRLSAQASSVVNQGTNTPSSSLPFTSALSAFPAVA